MALFEILEKGLEINFPINTRMSENAPENSESSIGATKIAVTYVRPNGSEGATVINWLAHGYGFINYFETSEEVVSGIFTGCIMTSYKRGGAKRVAHVHTDVDGSDQKKNYEDNIKKREGVEVLKDFKPFDKDRAGDEKAITALTTASQTGIIEGVTFGIITADNRAYSVFLKKTKKNSFVVSEWLMR